MANFEPYSGQHCESTALINMLRNRGIDLSEPLIFGLGQGLSFLYWDSKQMPFPFLGGRVKPDQLIVNATAALGIELLRQETTSKAKAEATLLAALDEGDVVGLKLDRYHLDFCHDDHHFAAHYLACIGHKDGRFIVVETTPLAIESTSMESMAEARASRGPMSSRSLSVRLTSAPFDVSDLANACTTAIRATAETFLKPPIKNMGYTGIAKTSTLMRRWYETIDKPDQALGSIGRSMEDNGTGGGFFRTLWAGFLLETASITGSTAYEQIADRYHRISKQWTEVSNLLRQADKIAVLEAAAIVEELAVEEREAMEELRAVVA
jgi:Domain of unknown function (DUF4872)/Butirosin biosynthesis protein H, N-terminal